jgi:hypothetical protein
VQVCWYVWRSRSLFLDIVLFRLIVNLKGRENLYKKETIELIIRFQNGVGEVILNDGNGKNVL